MLPLPIHIYFEIAALLTSFLLWRSLQSSRLRWFLPFLLIICLVELTGRYLARVLHQPNAWLYNLSVPLEYLFYCFVFLIHYNKSWYKTAAIIFIVLFS